MESLNHSKEDFELDFMESDNQNLYDAMPISKPIEYLKEIVR